ncbi:MAG: vWA domain-containing protein [Desulfovibrionaceae bacterium]
MFRQFCFTLALCMLCCAPLGVRAAEAPAPTPQSPQATVPLLQEGKKTLYQRIITHPAAALRPAPEASSPAAAPLKPFTVLYVYERQGDWLRVGAAPTAAQGWLESAKTTPWNQALTLLFTPRSQRAPVLFFKAEQDLRTLCTAPDMEQKLSTLESAVNAAMTTKGNAANLPPSIVAAEPPDSQGAVAASRFYLMPILAMTDPFEGVKFLQVASIDPGNSQKNSPQGQGKNLPRTGIALVMDTTISMKPYIDQSLNVVRAIYDQLEKDKLTNDVGFAVVAFRNSVKARPGLEYDTKIISDFTTAAQRKNLEAALSQVQEATVSSHAFNEDSLSGIKAAVDSLQWKDYASRVIILLSDAGPLPANDAYATVKMDIPELADFARTQGIWITALHITSPAGKANHASAEKAYRALTKLSNNRSNYLAIPAPTPAEGAKNFAAVSKTLAASIVSMVKNTADGKLMTKPKDEKPATTPQDEAARMAADLGYAMQLEFLGQQRANRAPSVIDSWIADMALAPLAKQQQVPTVEVAVLLTKNQLNDLAQQLRIIIDNAERTKKTDARDFFQGILSASARMVRDPSAAQGQNLAQTGILAEFLDGLPYKSDIMLLREEDWYRMSVGEQTAFINRLKSRLARYDEYDKDRAHWESFGAPNAGDWVYRVPLNMLP